MYSKDINPVIFQTSTMHESCLLALYYDMYIGFCIRESCSTFTYFYADKQHDTMT